MDRVARWPSDLFARDKRRRLRLAARAGDWPARTCAAGTPECGQRKGGDDRESSESTRHSFFSRTSGRRSIGQNGAATLSSCIGMPQIPDLAVLSLLTPLRVIRLRVAPVWQTLPIGPT
jgi:hypothetical protein